MLEIICENKCWRLSFFGGVSFLTGDFQIELFHSVSHHFDILNSVRVTFCNYCHRNAQSDVKTIASEQALKCVRLGTKYHLRFSARILTLNPGSKSRLFCYIYPLNFLFRGVLAWPKSLPIQTPIGMQQLASFHPRSHTRKGNTSYG